MLLGTCFAIDKNSNGTFVVTCKHVINENMFISGKEVKIVNNNIELDLSILFIKDLFVKPLIIKEEYENIENANIIGNRIVKTHREDRITRESIKNLKANPDVKLGSINAISLYPDKNNQENITKGYSGSPVICPKTNSVIGIVNIKENKKIFAIKSEYI